GLRVNLCGKRNNVNPTSEQARLIPSRAFHALGDETVLGNDAIEGAVVWFQERVVFARETDTGTVDTKLTILTDDGARIWTRYQGRIRLGRFGYRRLLAGKATNGGPDASSFEAKAFVAPRFETDSSKYKWLTERQCVAYGKVIVKNGVIDSARYDV